MRNLEGKFVLPRVIVAYDAEATIGTASSTATILTADGAMVVLPPMRKEAVSAQILAKVTDLLDRMQSHPR